MREIITRVYTFEELSASAQERAVEAIQCELGTWDRTEEIGEEILFTLAEAFHSPGWDTYGPGDFPGIDGMTVSGWDLGRGDYVTLSGCLTRSNAGALPWSDDIGDVLLDAQRDHTHIGVEDARDDDAYDSYKPPPGAEAMSEAIRDALHRAAEAGRECLRGLAGEDAAREHIEINELEFTEDGEPCS